MRLRARLAQARVALAQRLVELYQADKPDIVTVIMSSKGFADLLERGEFMQRVSEQDQRIIKIVRDAKADATATAAAPRQASSAASSASPRSSSSAATRSPAPSRASSTRRSASTARAQDKAHALGTVRAERQQLEGNLSGLKAEQAKIQATLQQAQGSLPAGPIKHGNGSLIWPVNGPITSPFCERRAWESCHPGIDIGVPAGTPIRAAAAGKVALMQSVGRLGRLRQLHLHPAHRRDVDVLRAPVALRHLAGRVSVSQGQVIGYVGCTGLCFGDAPALRGAHQRRGHQPAELPLRHPSSAP